MSSNSLPKTVLSAPAQTVASGDGQMSAYSSIRNKANFNEMVYVNALQCHEEAHQNRLKSLREELEYLKNTAWQYEAIWKHTADNTHLF